jgi:hypothetical protein
VSRGDGNRFDRRTNAELNTAIAPEQRRLLKRFLGQSLRGAETRQRNFVVPAGLTWETLEIYAQIARRTIAAGRDVLGVQQLRLELIERALHSLEP